MAAQQIQFAETIRAMKLAMKRRPDDSDSDTSIHAHTNRGNKLKRRARFVREGRLDDTGGLAYRKQVKHAGYARYTISTKPPLYDEDGDLYSPIDSEDDQRHAAPIEEDAFGNVQLEHLLRPLTAASELATHPSLSLAYKSKALTQMADEALEMVRREKANLWKVKRLFQRFRGDADWVPCEAFETEQDEMMLLPNEPEADGQPVPAVQALEQSALEMEAAMTQGDAGDSAVAPEQAAEQIMDGIETADMALQHAAEAQMQAEAEAAEQQRTGEATEPNHTEHDTNASEAASKTADRETVDGATSIPNPAIASIEAEALDQDAASEHTSNSGKETNGTNIPSHTMTTRAKARSPVATPLPSPTPSDSASIPAIHPWFIAPPNSIPDRDLGLPANEAEETRKILLLYVQKQEQIVRSLESLYSGLQRADRLRNDVFSAARAEGHVKDDGKGNAVTEMSDGEDWIDLEGLGLVSPVAGVALHPELRIQKSGLLGLEKGKDEVEDVEDEGRRVGGRRRRVNRM